MKGYQPLGGAMLASAREEIAVEKSFPRKKIRRARSLYAAKKRGQHEYRANPGRDGKPPVRECSNPA
jgi:hypothetical protein